MWGKDATGRPNIDLYVICVVNYRNAEASDVDVDKVN